MEPVGCNKGPPGIKSLNGNCARCPQKNEYVSCGGQGMKGVQVHSHILAAVNQAYDKQKDIGVDNSFQKQGRCEYCSSKGGHNKKYSGSIESDIINVNKVDIFFNSTQGQGEHFGAGKSCNGIPGAAAKMCKDRPHY